MAGRVFGTTAFAFGALAFSTSAAAQQGEVHEFVPPPFTLRADTSPGRAGDDCPDEAPRRDLAGGWTACLSGTTGVAYYAAGSGSWVHLKVTPEYARVYVNGTYIGTAQQFERPYRGMRIGLGPHRVELRAPGHKAQTFFVMQGPDRITELSKSLEPK
jgi:hypothetical protein